jgi:hypothetical protein
MGDSLGPLGSLGVGSGLASGTASALSWTQNQASVSTWAQPMGVQGTLTSIATYPYPVPYPVGTLSLEGIQFDKEDFILLRKLIDTIKGFKASRNPEETDLNAAIEDAVSALRES